MRERPGPPGEDTPRADMYQLYRAADWTSPPAPVIAQEVTPTAASWCATDGGARPWKGCLRAGSRRGVQLARSGRGASEPRQLYLACEAAILAVVTRSSTTRKAIETQRDLFLGRGMHDPRDAPRGSLRTGGLKLIVRPPPATLGEVRRARSANRARTMSSIDRSCPPSQGCSSARGNHAGTAVALGSLRPVPTERPMKRLTVLLAVL